MILYTSLNVGILDSKEISITVPPKGGNAGEKATGVIDLSNTSQMASEVFKFANAVKGKDRAGGVVVLLFGVVCYTVTHCTAPYCAVLRLKLSDQINSNLIESYPILSYEIYFSLLYFLLLGTALPVPYLLASHPSLQLIHYYNHII